MVSQEQKDHVEQQLVDVQEEEANVSSPDTTPTPDAVVSQDEQESQPEVATTGEPQVERTVKRRGRARGRLVNAEEVMPKPSLWPLAVAFSIAFVLFGVIAGLVVLVIGIVLLVASIVGWILERR